MTTAILIAVGSSSSDSSGGGRNKGKALFMKCAEKAENADVEAAEAETGNSASAAVAGVDFQEIEDEFERLHREMMEEDC